MMQEFFSLPSYPGYSPNPIEASSSVPPEGLLQIVVFVSWLEIISNKGKVRCVRKEQSFYVVQTEPFVHGVGCLIVQFSMTDMFEGGRAPGDLGFDPLKFGDNSASRARLELAELKNGRLAMIAFSGMIHQASRLQKPVHF